METDKMEAICEKMIRHNLTCQSQGVRETAARRAFHLSEVFFPDLFGTTIIYILFF